MKQKEAGGQLTADLFLGKGDEGVQGGLEEG
jgi:hypothetical protein